MNNEDRIKLYGLITDKFEVSADEIEKEFGIHVGRQLNAVMMTGPGGGDGGAGYSGGGSGDRHVMSDEEYYRRYGRSRGSRVANFLSGAQE